MSKMTTIAKSMAVGLMIGIGVGIPSAQGAQLDLSDSPLFLNTKVPPLMMLTMGRDHKLYYEAYNDASDLDNDGTIDVGYKPGSIDYYGYFDSYKCYTYDSGNNRFNPVSTTNNKKCSGQWSGDFLNYLTMSRMDALRKVLYGGYRDADTTSLTVLQRTHIPQDAHSWGKEYRSIANDGYDIREYTPLSLPSSGTRHLFANTTLLNTGSGEPRLRVLTNSRYRNWEWVSIERPVAGDECNDGSGRTNCATGASGWQIVPASSGASDLGIQNMTRTTYDTSGYGSYPNDHSDYDSLVANYATAGNEFGSGSVSTINGNGNPFGANDDYLTVFSGQLNIPAGEAGTYNFAVDGDDAVEVLIDGTVVAGWYGGHGNCNCQDHNGGIYLTAGTHTIEFRHQERGGGDNYYLYWDNATAASTMTDYQVRVKVCDSSMPENNCQLYASGSSKPTGLLQEYGENDSMLFGLLTGSYENNTAGGVIRRNIGSITDEIDPSTGQFTNTVGIIGTINRLQTINFGGNHEYDCGWIVDGPISNGECNMWGNPVAEMMYEGLRYFGGKSGPTSAYAYSGGAVDSSSPLNLPAPSWEDPYDASSGNPWCAKPFQLVISDINPSYDTDQLPGVNSNFGSGITGDLSGLNVETIANMISGQESGISGLRYIGQVGSTYDGAPTPKTVGSLGNIRGLAPEEPTKEGGYYSASVGYYGLTNDIHSIDGGSDDDGQKVSTFAVALASPLPQIEIPVDGKTITLVPFAKSVGGSVSRTNISSTQGQFQPTNQIVDFYVETLTSTYGKFRVNYEDVEQGADHDMDAIVEYEYTVNGDGTVTVTLTSNYAAGSIIQHIGYVISGTTADGTYLEVRDEDTFAGNDPDYFLDTPPGESPGGNWNDGSALPLTTSRTFTPGSGGSASLLKNPLWYAAKWGGFLDENGDDLPQSEEWDADSDGNPDNYFLVTNALTLRQQLDRAFTEVIARSGSASSASVNSGTLSSDTRVFQAKFDSGEWTGELLAYPIDPDTLTLGAPAWKASEQLPAPSARVIYTTNSSTETGVSFEHGNLSVAQQALLDSDQVAYLRGTQSKERSNGCAGCTYRNRDSLLGDIVNSDPAFVGKSPFRYPDVWPSGAPENNNAHSSFRSTYESRTKVIYTGANDGMLHGFNAETGTELVAYVPGPVYPNLPDLTSSSYSHKFYADGAPVVGDVYFATADKWRTVLVAGLNNGGQGVYALDITDPSNFTLANAANIVLWEFNDADTTTGGDPNGDADLGYTYSEPRLVRMQNGKWAAVFGNGYNNTETDGNASSTGNAVLYIVDVETGRLIKKISTGVGASDDPTGNSRPNGLASVAPVDLQGDHIVDYIYAGDLFGNLWKFDVSDSNTNQWDVAYKSGPNKLPLFQARDATSGGNAQPITVQPNVGRGPDGRGVMIYFGTGKYVETDDRDVSGATKQTFYAIHDKDTGTYSEDTLSRSDLLQQEILKEVTNVFDGNSFDVRVTSDNEITTERGWYLDLVSPNDGVNGERQVTDPVLRGGRVIFTTLIPDSDVCASGGTSWVMELNADDGSRLGFSPFDFNNDGYFSDGDYLTVTIGSDTVTVPASGRRSRVGINPEPAGLLDKGDDTCSGPDCVQEIAVTSGSSGDIEIMRENAGISVGRQSWIELR